MAAAIRARLGPLVSRVQSTVEPVLTKTGHTVAEQYKGLMERNKEYIVKDSAAADKLFKQWFFTNLSKIPAAADACKAEYGQLQQKLAHRGELPVTEAATYALFLGEVYAWFCVGEIAGRGFTFGGYNI